MVRNTIIICNRRVQKRAPDNKVSLVAQNRCFLICVMCVVRGKVLLKIEEDVNYVV